MSCWPMVPRRGLLACSRRLQYPSCDRRRAAAAEHSVHYLRRLGMARCRRLRLLVGSRRRTSIASAREGILFENCFTSNPKCSPCRASILTGRNTWQLEEACCHTACSPRSSPFIPYLLEQSGYVVGLTGKGWGPGDFVAGGFKRNPAGPSFDEHKRKPPTPAMGKIDYARNFEAFLKQRPSGKPFCFWMGFHDRIA